MSPLIEGMHELGCPRCGSASIREWNTTSIAYNLGPAIEAVVEGDKVRLVPDYRESGEVADAGGEELEEYRCRDCDFAAKRIEPFVVGTEQHQQEARKR